MNTDGTIRIDTKVETQGFNAGIQKVKQAATDAMLPLLRSASRIGIVVKSVLKAVSLLTVGFLGVILILQRFSSELFETLEKGIDKTSAYYGLLQQLKGAFNNFKGAIFSVFATLLQAALPFLVQAVTWLTRMLDVLNQIIAALLGQKTVMRAVVKSAQDQQKAVKGSLAAFDELNVLAQKQAQTDPNPITFENIPIEERNAEIAQKIKDLWNSVKTAAIEAWNGVVSFLRKSWETIVRIWNDLGLSDLFGKLWNNAMTTMKKMAVNTLEAFLGIRDGILQILNGITEIFRGIFQGDWTLIIQGFKDIFSGAFKVLENMVRGTLTNISLLINGWIAQVQAVMPYLVNIFTSTWNTITQVAANFAKGVVNLVIEIVNGMMRAIAYGINHVIAMLNSIRVNIPSWVPIFGGQSWGTNISPVAAPQIPRLAEGAVIPPNAQFLAVLGDQRSGRNLEAPEALIRQIIQEEVAGIGQNLEVTMPVYLDGEKIYQGQKRVQLRHGKSLIAGGIA